VGEIQSIDVDTPTRISLADPKIADLVKVEGTEAIITGKSPGSTTLNIWDKYGHRSITVRVAVEDLDNLKNRLEQILSNVKISNLAININRDEGKIILQGDALVADKEKLNEILGPFSKKVINLININEDSSLVQVDVQILELSKNVTDQLGVTWMSALQVREEPFSGSSGSGGGTTTLVTTLGKIATFPRVWRVVNFSRDALTAKLNLLISEGKGRVLSRPKLVCLSGKEAQFLVGGQIPIVTTTTSSGGNVSTNVEFRDYGINLKIKPVVKSEDQIDTTINTEVSSIDYGNAITVSGTTIPAFATRSASTQLYMKDGQTIFIAGLIKNNEANNIQRLPAISKIPILGELFKSKNFSDNQTELVISLTPTIIKSEEKKPSAAMDKVAAAVKAATPKSTEPVELINEEPALVMKELPEYLADYTRMIQSKISQAATYPEEARQLGWEGTVRLSLRVLPDGTLSVVKVKQSSGYEIFDDNAIEAAKKSAPFPAFPLELRAREITIEVPVVYNLTTNS
jgi:pilus assembly protein CpaC